MSQTHTSQLSCKEVISSFFWAVGFLPLVFFFFWREWYIFVAMERPSFSRFWIIGSNKHWSLDLQIWWCACVGNINHQILTGFMSFKTILWFTSTTGNLYELKHSGMIYVLNSCGRDSFKIFNLCGSWISINTVLMWWSAEIGRNESVLLIRF